MMIRIKIMGNGKKLLKQNQKVKVMDKRYQIKF